MKNASRGFLLSVLLLGGCTNSFGDKVAGGALLAPTGLAGTPGGPVLLAWSDNSSGETGYRLEVHTAAFGAPPFLDVVQLPANTSATTYSGPPNTTLHFRVYAVTATTQSDPSNEITVLTPNTPNAPTNFTALARSYTQVNLQWVETGNTTFYRLERYDANTATFMFITDLAAPATSYTDTLPYTIPAQFPIHRITGFNGNGSGPSRTAEGMTFWRPRTGIAATTPPTAGPYDYGLWSSLAVGGGNQLFVSYYDAQLRELWFNKYSPSVGWAGASVSGSIGRGFDGTSVALDRSGNIHIAGVDYGSGQVYLHSSASGTPGSWSSSAVDSSDRKHPQLRIWQGPVSDTFHLIYHYADSFHAIRYARKVGAGAWTFFSIPATARMDSVPALVIDASGEAHIVFSTEVPNDLYHWSPSGNFDPIATTLGPSEHHSVAIDGSGVLHVAYNEATPGRLMYATNPGGVWTTQVAHAHTRGNLGRHNSIVADGPGNVYISYYDVSFGNLWQARKPVGAAGFVQMLVAESGDVGRYTSSALDGGNVVTTCYDATPGVTNLQLFWVPQ